MSITNREYNTTQWVLAFLTQLPTNVTEAKCLIDKMEEEIRQDERKNIANFMDTLGKKLTRELDAYRDYLDGSASDAPAQIKLEFLSV